MAGHSQFKNIMHRKGAQDKKRAKIFTKIAREITVAAKLGSDSPDTNPRLRAAILEGKANNMPKDNIQKAIKKAQAATTGSDYTSILYEGYGPFKVAVIVEALTNNKNRSASDIRSTFTKRGGTFGSSGSVSFMFNKVGIIEFNKSVKVDDIFDDALECGVEDIIEKDDVVIFHCMPDSLHKTMDSLEDLLKLSSSAVYVSWIPTTNIIIENTEDATSFFNFIEALEDIDDVQKVYTNVDVPEKIIDLLNSEIS